MRYLCGHCRVVNGLDLMSGTADEGDWAVFVRGVIVVGAGEM